MSDDPLKPTRTPDGQPGLTGKIDTAWAERVHPAAPDPRPVRQDADPDDGPTPALACPDCAVVWTQAGTEWAFCPRCGGELEEWEVADE